MSKGKKIAIGVSSCILAIIIIVLIVFFSIVYTKDLSNDIDFFEKTYVDAHVSPVDIKVASYNVKSGYNTKENLVKIRDQIKSKNVNIVGLQEVDSDDMLRSKDLKCVSTLSSDIYTHHIYAPTSSLFLGDNYGIMTMADREILESNKMYLPLPNKSFIIRGEPRVVVRSIVNIDGVDVAFYNTHLSFENNVKMKDGSEMRDAQIKFIYDTMQSDPCKYKVLVGDMNILSFDELAIFKDNGYKMVNNENTHYKSYRGDDVDFFSLDNIIYTSNMELVTSEMIDNDLSDHNMLYAHLRIA